MKNINGSLSSENIFSKEIWRKPELNVIDVEIMDTLGNTNAPVSD